MSRDAQETVDLMDGLVTPARASRIAEKNKEKVALFEITFHRLVWYKFKDEEDVKESSKTFLVFTVQENNQETKLSVGEEGKQCTVKSGNNRYKGSQMFVIVENTRLPIKCIRDTVNIARRNPNRVELHNIVIDVEGKKKNLLSVSQLTAANNYLIFGPNDIKVYRDVKKIGTPILEGEKQDFVYTQG